MAWSASGVFVQYELASHNRVAAFDIDTDSLKCALYNNTGTPDKTVTAALSAYNAGQWVTGNEVFQAGQWAQGGIVIAGVTVVAASNVVTVDATDVASGTAATLLNVFGCQVYDDTLTTPVADQGVSFHYYGGTQSVTAGQFINVWAAAGLFTVTV
jgi:hypothetical protein